MKFRKKPVTIEAFHLSLTAISIPSKRPDWFNAALERGETEANRARIKQQMDEPFVTILTLEGEFVGSLGDWIIQGVKGELYPCKPEIFAATYEPADVDTVILPDGSVIGVPPPAVRHLRRD